MNILTRYIASAYLRVFGLCLGAFITVYLVVDFLEKLGRFARYNPSWVNVAQFFLYKIPEIFSQVAPLAVLMATLLALGMLSRTSEITAMRSCGVSLRRISTPIIVIAVGVSLLTIVCNEVVLPTTYRQMRHIEEVLIRKKSMNTFFRQNNIWHRDANAILQARVFDPVRQELGGVTIWEFAEGMQPIQRIDAKRGFREKGQWVLYEATTRKLSDGLMAPAETIRSLPVALNLAIDDLKVVDKTADNMGFFKLRKYIRKLREAGYDVTRYEVQMHAKLSLPFGALIMAFLGIPFSLRGGRSSGIAIGIGASIIIGFGYFISNSMLLSFGTTGLLPPLVAAWAANAIFAMTGIWLAMTINR